MTDSRTDAKEAFGIYLASLLKSKRIGQQELATYLQVTVGMISRFATGRNLPSDTKMEAITNFLAGRISHEEEMKLMQYYMSATSPIFASIETKSRSVLENHFLSLFHQLKEIQQNKLLRDMLQAIEDNNEEMAHNAGFENNSIKYPNAAGPGHHEVTENSGDSPTKVSRGKKAHKKVGKNNS
jgi:transcriptional regulator with XRE-family HTH domain